MLSERTTKKNTSYRVDMDVQMVLTILRTTATKIETSNVSISELFTEMVEILTEENYIRSSS